MRLTRVPLLVAVLSLALVWGCGRAPEPKVAEVPTPAPKAEAGNRMTFEATAYSIEGRTASGTPSREGIVAADPDILPLGTRIRLDDAGPYAGVYVVEDTGPAIKGRELDIYVASDVEAKRFGRKIVQVEVLEPGRRAGTR